MAQQRWNDWGNQRDAQISLESVDTALGCPFVLPNGYFMDEWAFLTKSAAEDRWGFARAEARPGRTREDLESGLEPGRTLRDKRPDDWIASEEI